MFVKCKEIFLCIIYETIANFMRIKWRCHVRGSIDIYSLNEYLLSVFSVAVLSCGARVRIWTDNALDDMSVKELPSPYHF